MIELRELNEKYSNELAEILSTDKKLHEKLSPKSHLKITNGTEYRQGCIKWETNRCGRCFVIVKDDRAIGSISFVHKNEKMVGIGYWLKSNAWEKGIGTQAFKEILEIVKDTSYTHVTGSIVKGNTASKRIWEKCNATFMEDNERYYPIIKL